MNPTVSESRILRLEGNVIERKVGSSVANMRDEAITPALVTALNNVDLPAFVYPTIATVSTGTASRRWRC